MKIGVLDIQGSVIEHVRSLEAIGVNVVRVKNPSDLDVVAGLIIPGGESTTLGKLLVRFGLREKILKRASEGMKIWGTCAGMILLAKHVSGNGEKVLGLGLMDIDVERNAYGRQLDSFEDTVVFDGKEIAAVFIRAPKVMSVGEGSEVLAKYEDEIVAVRQGQFLATSFHPEMTDDLSVHKYFVSMCE